MCLSLRHVSGSACVYLCLWMWVCWCALCFLGTRVLWGHLTPAVCTCWCTRAHPCAEGQPSLVGAMCGRDVQDLDVAVRQMRFSSASRPCVFEQICCIYVSPRFMPLLPHH